MDVTTKESLGWIINYLIDNIEMAKSELNRLTFDDEAANDGANDKQGKDVNSNDDFGTFNLPIHYTLGRGMKGALGIHVEETVSLAYRTVSDSTIRHGVGNIEMDYRGIGMSIDMYRDRDSECVCLHLELVQTNFSIDVEEFVGDIEGAPQGRSLN